MKKSKQTLQQKRAEHALKRIKDADEKYKDKEERKKFVSYAESAPGFHSHQRPGTRPLPPFWPRLKEIRKELMEPSMLP